MKHDTYPRSLFIINLLLLILFVALLSTTQVLASGGGDSGSSGGDSGSDSGGGVEGDYGGGGGGGGVSGSGGSSGSDNDSGGGYSGSGADADANGASGNDNNGGGYSGGGFGGGSFGEGGSGRSGGDVGSDGGFGGGSFGEGGSGRSGGDVGSDGGYGGGSFGEGGSGYGGVSDGSDNDSGGGYSGSGADADANGASGNDNNGGGSGSNGSGKGTSGSGSGSNADSGNSTGGSTQGKSSGFFGGLFSGNPGKTGGFFGGILGGIKGFFGGVFSGSKSSTDTPSRGFPETGGGDRSDFSTTPKNIDLVPETQKVTILTDKTTFAGQIKLLETTDPDIRRGATYSGNSSVTITNKLLVDYGCDSTVDSEQEFTVPFTTLQSGTIRVIPLSTQFTTGDAGDHCFAFEIDTKNAVPEKDEANNKTEWHTFTVEGTTIPDDPTVSIGCPVYQLPICASDEKIISGGIDANGCQEAPQCISNKPTSPDDISFEVKSYVLSDATGSGVRTRVTTKDWSTNNITLTGDQKLAFRWDASKYNKCLAFIYPETYVFNSNTTAVTGNTEVLGIAIKSLNHEYSIECTTGDVIHKQTIDVTAN